MRLICPHCMSGVTVADDAAGKEATCPNCGKTFPTPARYSAAVVPDAGVGAVAGAIDPGRSTPHPEPVSAPAPRPVPEAASAVATTGAATAQTPAAPPGYVPPAPAGAPPVDSSGFLTSAA